MKKVITITAIVLSTLLIGRCFMHNEALDALHLTPKDFEVDNFHIALESRLYRSGQIPAARLGAYLTKFNIKTIINLRGWAERTVLGRGEEEAAAQADAKVLYAPMAAHRASTKEEIAGLLKQFDMATEPVLIHCSQGINRTGEACALFLIHKHGATNEEALKQFDAKFGYVFEKRPEKYESIKKWERKK